MTTPRVAFGATPLEGERHQGSGEAGSPVSLDWNPSRVAVVRVATASHFSGDPK